MKGGGGDYKYVLVKALGSANGQEKWCRLSGNGVD